MKFTITKNSLVNSLKIANSVIDHSNVNPILTAIMIQIKNKQITLIATNGNISFKEKIEEGIEIIEEGEFLIKAKVFYNILSKLSNQKITIQQVDKNILKINDDNFSCELNLMDSFSYPIINFDHKDWNLIKFSKNDLSSILQQVCPFSSNQSDGRFDIINGTNFKSINNQIEATATDGFKLSYYKFDAEFDAEFDITIQTNILNLINEILSNKKKEKCSLYIKNQNGILNIDNLIMNFSFYTNKYPNLKKILFDEQQNYIEFEKESFYKAINRGYSLTSVDKKPSVDLSLNGADISINFYNDELGNSHEVLSNIKSNIDSYKGKFNQLYLSLILSLIDQKNIKMSFNKENAPVLFKVSDSNIKLILPIKSI